VGVLGNLDRAEEMLVDVEKLARQMELPRRLASAVGNRGIIRTRRGDHVGAEDEFRTALRYARREGVRSGKRQRGQHVNRGEPVL
jgi:hypothetical protein